VSAAIFKSGLCNILCALNRELRHRNLVSLIGVSIDATPVYIVTEYMAKVCIHTTAVQVCTVAFCRDLWLTT